MPPRFDIAERGFCLVRWGPGASPAASLLSTRVEVIRRATRRRSGAGTVRCLVGGG